MTVHSLHIFDRKGKTLFTKRYSEAAMQQLPQAQKTPTGLISVDEQLSEQRKLVFGMLFSLRELVGSLGPEGEPSVLHSVKTGSGTLHNYETLSGLRFAMYTDNDTKTITKWGSSDAPSVREALRHIYIEIWVECVIRSPLYRHGEIVPPEEITDDSKTGYIFGKVDIRSTLFEKKLDEYLVSMPWFK